jgi:predicted PurR-regulated permease PerM
LRAPAIAHDPMKSRGSRSKRVEVAAQGSRSDERAPLPLHPGARAAARMTLALVLVGAALWTASDFLPALVWAAMIAIALWPLHVRANALASRDRSGTVAFLLTLVVALLIFVPIALVTYELAEQSDVLAAWIAHARDHGIAVPDWIGRLPVAAAAVEQWWRTNLARPESAAAWVRDLHLETVVKTFGGQLLHRMFMLFVALIALFVILRNGDQVGGQLFEAADRFFGDPGEGLAARTVAAIRGTVSGAVGVATCEGLLIGAGYVLAGVPNAALFTVLTVAFAMVPLGAWTIFTVAALTLLASGGSEVAAAGVFAWGVVVMLCGDQLVWPLLVGDVVRLPFLFAFVGIFGGLASFGLVGLFLGPVIMAAVFTIWREWVMLRERRKASRAPDGP